MPTICLPSTKLLVSELSVTTTRLLELLQRLPPHPLLQLLLKLPQHNSSDESPQDIYVSQTSLLINASQQADTFFLYQDSPKIAGYAYIQLKKQSHAIAATMQSPRYTLGCELPSQQLYLDAN
jgi:hypothetical protein